MKKFLAIFLASAMALSIAGCGKDEIPSQGTGALDENGEVRAGTTIDGAGAEVDLAKLPGDALSSVEGDINSKDTLGDYTVSIDDAKIFDNNGDKVFVVTFTFKNKSDAPVAFDNVMVPEVAQGGNEIMPVVVTDVEGINILSAAEIIQKGAETTVQKTYKLTDTETAVDVLVYEYGKSAEGMVAKTFNLK